MTAPVIRSKIDGEGIPFVLLHAFPLDHRLWDYYEVPGYRLIKPDFPGFGLSPLGPEELTIEQAAEGLKAHLDGLGIDRPVILAGCSMGGYWAMEFARQFPDRVSRLFLVSTRSGLDSPERREKRLETAERVLREGTAWYAPILAEGLLGAGTRQRRPALTAWVEQMVREADPKAVAASQKAMARRRDQGEFMRTCPAPSYWYVGTEDPSLDVLEVKTMAQESRKSGYETFQCGHLIPVEMGKPLVISMHRILRSDANPRPVNQDLFLFKQKNQTTP